MLFNELSHKPPEKWTLQDLQDICDSKVAESRYLEFKRGLSANGNVGKGQGKPTAKDRDKLAKEVVAFANSYGGYVILGIEDNDSAAEKLAKPLPKINKLAQQLTDCFSDMIDPPLRNLGIFPIPGDGSKNDGYLVIKVPESAAAPHGFGKPPQCYIRNGERSEPMTMRDIHNVLWETRSKRERIEIEFKKQQEAFEAAMPVSACRQMVQFRFSVMLEHAADLINLYDSIEDRQFFNVNGVPVNIWQTPNTPGCWFPEPHGARLQYWPVDRNTQEYHNGYWEVDESGVATVIGSLPKSLRYGSQYPFSHCIKICKDVGRLLATGFLLAHKAGMSDSDLLLDGQVYSDLEYKPDNIFLDKNPHKFDRPAHIRPVRLSLDNAEKTCRRVQTIIWRCFGQPDATEDLVFSAAQPVLDLLIENETPLE